MSLLMLDKSLHPLEGSNQEPSASCQLFAETSIAEGDLQNSSIVEIGIKQKHNIDEIGEFNISQHIHYQDIMREGERKRSLLFLQRDTSSSQQPQAIMEAKEDILSFENLPISSKDFPISFIDTQRNENNNEENGIKIRKAVSNCQQIYEENNVKKQSSTSKDNYNKFNVPIIDIQSPDYLSLNAKNAVIQTTKNNSDQTPAGKLELIHQRKNSMFYKNTTPHPEGGGVFQLIFYVNRFIFHLKRTLLFFRPHQLNQLQLELIGDIAAQDFQNEGFGVPYRALSSFATPQRDEINSQLSYSVSGIQGAFSNVLNNLTTASKQKQQRARERKIKLLIKKILRFPLCKISLKYSRNLYSLLRKFSRTTIDKIPLFDSNSRFFRFWEILICLCDLISVFYIPFKYCFQTIRLVDLLIFKVLFPIIYGLNLIFNFNVAVYNRGTLITSRQKILSLYLRSYFFIDMLAATAEFTTQLFYFVRIFYSNPTIAQIRQSMLMNSKLNVVEQFMSLSFKIILFAHIFSCIWHKLGIHYLEDNEGWMYEFKYQNDSIVSRYITCFYFAVVTMSTIGYGDIYAVTTGERILMIFCVFIACGLYGYTLNSIGTIISNLKSQNENYTKKQAQLEEYLQLHQVDIGLRNRARKYIEYVYEQENMLKRDGQENLNLLNSFLKEEIQKDINKRVLQKARTIFQGISKSSKFFERLSSIVKEQTFGPDELVHISGSSQPPALYIISYGEVELFIQRRDHLNALKVIKILTPGCIFGQHGFFTNNQKNCLSARSVGVTYISSIGLEDFQLLLSEFVEEKERFYNIRDMVLINNKNDLINLNCISCTSDGHSIEHCPYLSYFPVDYFDNQKVIKIVRNVQREEEKSRNFKLKKRNSLRHSSLAEVPNVQTQVKEFQTEKKDLIVNLLNQIYLFMEDEQENYEGHELGSYLDGERDETEVENHQSHLSNHFAEAIKYNLEKNKEYMQKILYSKKNSGIQKTFKGQRSLGVDQNHMSLSESEIGSSQQKVSLSQLPQNTSETEEEKDSSEEQSDQDQEYKDRIQKKSKTQLSKLKSITNTERIQSTTDEQQQQLFFPKQIISNARKSLPVVMHHKTDINCNIPNTDISSQLMYQMGLSRRQSNEMTERKQSLIMSSFCNLNQPGYGFSQSPLFHQSSHKNKNVFLGSPLSPQIQEQHAPNMHQNVIKSNFYNQNHIILAPSQSNFNQQANITTANSNSSNTLVQSQRSNGGGIYTNSFVRNNTLLNNNNNNNNKSAYFLNVPEDLYTQDKSYRPTLVTKQGDKSWTNRQLFSKEDPFDRIKQFLIYFPHNNFEAICNKWNEIIKTKSFKRGSKRGKKPPFLNRQAPIGLFQQKSKV